jgi:hypothetical protein
MATKPFVRDGQEKFDPDEVQSIEENSATETENELRKMLRDAQQANFQREQKKVIVPSKAGWKTIKFITL